MGKENFSIKRVNPLVFVLVVMLLCVTMFLSINRIRTAIKVAKLEKSSLKISDLIAGLYDTPVRSQKVQAPITEAVKEPKIEEELNLAENTITTEDLIKYFKDCGLEAGRTWHPNYHLEFSSHDIKLSCSVTINGGTVSIYLLNADIPEQKRVLDEAKATGKMLFFILGGKMSWPVTVNSPFMINLREEHPDKDKIIDAFKEWQTPDTERFITSEQALEIAKKVCMEYGWDYEHIRITSDIILDDKPAWGISTLEPNIVGSAGLIIIDKNSGDVLYKGFGPSTKGYWWEARQAGRLKIIH